MENTEQKQERRIPENAPKAERERNHLEAQRAAEARLGSAEMDSSRRNQKEGLEQPDKQGDASERMRLSPQEAAERRLGAPSEGLRGTQNWQRLEALSAKRGLTKEESRELADRLNTALDVTDPHWREADRRTADGKVEFERNPEARREFSHLAGTEEHKRWELEMLSREAKAGRLRGVDFELEAVLPHPDGGSVRLDYVDYRNNVIIDRKPLAEGETEDQLQRRYEEQRTRHVEAYEHVTGRRAEYRYSLYPSPRDL